MRKLWLILSLMVVGLGLSGCYIAPYRAHDDGYRHGQDHHEDRDHKKDHRDDNRSGDHGDSNEYH